MRHDTTPLTHILVGDQASQDRCVYEDRHFRRQRIRVGQDAVWSADVCIDTLIDVDCTLLFISLQSVVEVTLTVPGASAEQTDQGLLLWFREDTGVLWFPQDPLIRRYDVHGRIELARPGSVRVEPHPTGLALVFSPAADKGCCELCVVRASRDAESFVRQIRPRDQIEVLPVVKARWFKYDGIRDVWRGLADGKVYKTSPFSKSHRAWVDQQLACTLYDYMTFLAERTGKTVYRAIAEWIAYAVLLTVSEDGLWRHGSSTDCMETHFRMQIDGIMLLLNHHEATGRPVFLDGARRTARAVLDHAQPLDGGRLWFLHDTLEEEWSTACEIYPRLFRSAVMGKAPGNTLCLNTHIWTLILLHRLAAIDPKGPYTAAFDAGMKALHHVAQWAPAGWLYRLLYAPYDALVRRAAHRRRTRLWKMARVVERLLRRVVPICKRRWPRLFMPNGYIERDLCATALSGGYHFVTLRDLAVLYAQCRVEWLRPILERSVRYSLRTRLAVYLAPDEPRGGFLVDVLALCAYAVDAGYGASLRRVLDELSAAGLGLSSDVLALPILRPWTHENLGLFLKSARTENDSPL